MYRSTSRPCTGRSGVQRGIARSSYLLLVLVVLVVAAFFGFRHLSSQPDAQVISQEEQTEERVKAEIADPGPEPSTQTRRAPGARAAGRLREEEVVETEISVGTIAPGTSVQPNAPLARGTARAPDYDYAYAKDLVRGLAKFSPAAAELGPLDIEEINEILEELKRQGPAAVVAIEEYLGTGEDLSFAVWGDAKDLGSSTLRLALMDTLGQIGGREALDMMVRMLPATNNPVEIATLAEGLEGNAPGVYRMEIVDTTREILALALESDPKDFQGLAHLFGVIQAYGDETLAADLDAVYQGSDSAWAENALMALPRLPEGQGVPYLVDIANEMAEDPNRDASKYRMALRMLAQATRKDPDAAGTLMQLARDGRLGTSDLVSVARTLGGKEYQLITAGSEIAKKSKAPTILNGRAPETWTNEEVDQRLDLIDQFLRIEADPAVTSALNESHERLLAWKARPMVNGKRVTR